MMRASVNLDDDLYVVLIRRAEYNHRSLSGEILYLLECALASEVEGNQQILRTLLMAQGGVKSLKKVEEVQSLEQTAKDEPLL